MTIGAATPSPWRIVQHSRSGRSRRWSLPVALGVTAALLWPLVGLTSPAGAHAVVVSTSPPPGATLDEAPVEVSVTFDEPVAVEADSIVVIDADGEVVSAPAEVQGTTISAVVDLPGDGWYAVSWWTVSTDGHPVSGAWTFRVGEGEELAPAGLEDRALAASRPGDAARWTFYSTQWGSTLAAAITVGTLFVALLARSLERVQRLAIGACAAGATLAVLAAGSNGPYSSVSAAWFAGPASDQYLARAVLLLVVLAVVLATRSRPADTPEPSRPVLARAAPVLLAAVALGVPVLSGHASSEGVGAVMAVSAHMVVAGAWLGAIPALLLLVQRRDPHAHEVLHRFSRAAAWLLVATLMLGATGTWLLTGGLTNATQSWGWALFAKFALLGVAIVAGAWNRWNVVPRVSELPTAQATTAMRVEALALIAIVAASVALTHNGPPSADAASQRGPAIVDAMVEDDLRLQVIVDPATVGPNDLHVFVLDDNGLPASIEELTLTLASDEVGIAPIEQPLSDLGAGHYSGRTDDMGIAGIWELHVVIRPDTFTQTEHREDIVVAG